MKPSLLIIEDNAYIRSFLHIAFEVNNFKVNEATSAEDALVAINNFPFDLVILDLGLPDKDGLDVLKELRNSHPSLPIIILTVRSEQSIREKAYALGANAYLTKPFRIDEILDVVRTLVLVSAD